jgi:FixJ family two-component response regulator
VTDPAQTVYVVDDDDAVRDSLLELMESMGIPVEGFDSAASFLDHFDPALEGCLVLDIRMPGMSGMELQARLTELGSRLPIIFITGHGDVPMAVEAMKNGAIEFIQKPFRDQELLDCIQGALEKSEQERQRYQLMESVERGLQSLTVREREILDHIVDGHANKFIALELGISQRTVENHRARILRKMGVRSTPELIRLVVSSREG